METRRISAAEVQESRFYQLPKWLVKEDQFRTLSNDAKILYAILKDRHDLSLKNKWVDDNGDIYMICTRVEMCELLGSSDKTVTKAVKDLVKYRLIEEVRQGCNKPNLIYLMTVSFDGQWNRNISESKNVNIPYPNTEILRANDTDFNQTDFNQTDNKRAVEATEAAKAEIQELTNFYNECFNKKITKQIILAVGEATHSLNIECVHEAMKRAAIRGKDWSYAYGIIKSWIELGIKTLADVEAKDQKKVPTAATYSNPANEPLTHKNKFNRTYSHNWDQDELDAKGADDLDYYMNKPHQTGEVDIRAKYGLK